MGIAFFEKKQPRWPAKTEKGGREKKKKNMGRCFCSVARKDEDPTDPEVVGVGGPWKLDGLHIGLPAGCYCDAWNVKIDGKPAIAILVGVGLRVQRYTNM